MGDLNLFETDNIIWAVLSSFATAGAFLYKAKTDKRDKRRIYYAKVMEEIQSSRELVIDYSKKLYNHLVLLANNTGKIEDFETAKAVFICNVKQESLLVRTALMNKIAEIKTTVMVCKSVCSDKLLIRIKEYESLLDGSYMEANKILFTIDYAKIIDGEPYGFQPEELPLSKALYKAEQNLEDQIRKEVKI